MTSAGMPRPYVVAASFSDAAGGYLLLGVYDGANPEHAVGKAVAAYYLNGGTKPLVITNVLAPTRETLETGLKMLDAIDAADKTEAAKVVTLVPPPTDDPPPAEDPSPAA